MTEEEKKEFEEFLKWKKEKAEKEEQETSSVNSDKKDEVIQNDENGLITQPIIIGLIAVVVIVLLFIVLGTCSNKNLAQQTQEEYVAADSIEEVVDVLEAEPESSNKTWDFSIEKDPMTDTKNIWAKIISDDYISQDFPYEGYTYASITVRYMKKYGYDVIIQITKGQINGRSYSGTNYVTARFDEGSPKKYYFNEAADGSSEMIFIRNTSDFISRCKKAKDIKIDIPVYKNGRPVFSFHVDEPLVWREE